MRRWVGGMGVRVGGSHVACIQLTCLITLNPPHFASQIYKECSTSTWHQGHLETGRANKALIGWLDGAK